MAAPATEKLDRKAKVVNLGFFESSLLRTVALAAEEVDKRSEGCEFESRWEPT